jgi:predicted nucleic acid-binding Zn ribbon protein
LGEVGAEQLDLPASRRSELGLAAAWLRVAGERLVQHAPQVAVRRGVLEVQVRNEAWIDTLRQLLPTLVERMAEACPGRGITSARLRPIGQGPADSSRTGTSAVATCDALSRTSMRTR